MATNLAAGPAPRAGRQEWIGLAVLILAGERLRGAPRAVRAPAT